MPASSHPIPNPDHLIHQLRMIPRITDRKAKAARLRFFSKGEGWGQRSALSDERLAEI